MAVRPIIITTWQFGLAASREGYCHLADGATALDAVEQAANVAELDPEVTSVGYGGMPNAAGVVELDAAIMNGPGHRAGAVAGLVGIARAISVARCIMERTPHVMLVGERGRRFALAQGFAEQELLTPLARTRWQEWKESGAAAQVAHFDPEAGMDATARGSTSSRLTPDDHDTIGLCALDSVGNLAAGCTTSGMAWKLPGRVGDSPIIGSGLYVDNAVGAAAATGHGDEMMKACLSYRVVALMENGLGPQRACEQALRYLLRKRPPDEHGNYGAALVAVSLDGEVGGAATVSGFRSPDRLWQWAVASELYPDGKLFEGPYVTASEILHDLVPPPTP